jgi:hypothetical protein
MVKLINVIKKINFQDLYKIGLYEVIILFIILFFTYTMPMTVYKFTSSFFGKVVSLISIIYASYCNIAYGIVLAVLFIGISELGYLEEFTHVEGFTHVEEFTHVEGFIQKPEVPSAKAAFIKDHCSVNKITFNRDTLPADYPELVFTDGVCDPCDPTCRYVISNTAENLYDFDHKIKPEDSTYINQPKSIENFESAIMSDLKSKYKKNKRKAVMLKDGFTGKIVDKVTHYARKYKL